MTDSNGNDICSNIIVQSPTTCPVAALAFPSEPRDFQAMTIPYYEVLAFTSRLFAGNPAGICILKEWLPDQLMQKIAAENNLAETAFFIDRGSSYDIRWMTPTVEMDLCGHATLASAHVLFQHLGYRGDTVRFQSHSGGELKVDRSGDRLVLDFPSRPAEACEAPARLAEGLRAQPREVFKGRDYLAVFESEADVRALAPVLDIVAELDANGVIVTAPGDDCDFVSRYFAPRVGVPEDPVTGSVHCALIPYWAKRLGKTKLHARQLSPRGGELFCEDRGERVGIGGTAVTYVEGTVHLP
jgi:predicted PhzF superfamily epimerase YddE/YHI9